MAMTLDEFFKTPKREEYVSQEPINVEGYLKSKEVAAPVKPEVAKVAEAAPKVEPQKLQELKQIFKAPEVTLKEPQAMEQQPQAAAPTAPVAASSLIDVNKVRSQAEAMAPQASWSDVLMGLIPVAMDAFSGGYGDALDVSGKYYMDKASGIEKRKQTLEDKLMEIEKSRAIAGAKSDKLSRRFQAQNIVDPETNQIIKANFDTATGNYFDTNGKQIPQEKIRAGYAVIPEEFNRRANVTTEEIKERGDYFGRGVRLDPNTGLLAKVQNGKMIPLQVSDSQLNPKHQKDLKGITDKFLTTDLYKKTAQVLTASDNVAELISAANDRSNAVAANSARTQIARMSGEVGALSDSDIERSGGSPSIKESAKRFATLQKSGNPLSARDIQEINEVARIYAANARRKLNDAVALMEMDFVQNYGGIPGAVQTKMGAYIPVEKKQKAKAAAPKKILTFEEWKAQNANK
jgi:hypothetical protein